LRNFAKFHSKIRMLKLFCCFIKNNILLGQNENVRPRLKISRKIEILDKMDIFEKIYFALIIRILIQNRHFNHKSPILLGDQNFKPKLKLWLKNEILVKESKFWAQNLQYPNFRIALILDKIRIFIEAGIKNRN